MSNDLNRRSALEKRWIGIAAGAGQISSAATATVALAGSPALMCLIKDHSDASRSIDEAGGRIDSTNEARESMSETAWIALIERAQEDYDNAVVIYDRALKAICEHRCATWEEEVGRLRYLAEASAGAHWPDDSSEFFEALLDIDRKEEA